MFYVYVLQSEIDKSYYKGYTQNLEQRLQHHNQGKSKYTASKRPWHIIYYEKFSTRKEAVEREKYFKTAAGRRFLKKVL
jgi:putative endonuclease